MCIKKTVNGKTTIWFDGVIPDKPWRGEYIGQIFMPGDEIRGIGPVFSLSCDMMLKYLQVHEEALVHAIILPNEKPDYDTIVVLDPRFADQQDEEVWARHGKAEIVDDWHCLIEYNDQLLKTLEDRKRLDEAIASLPAGRHGLGHRRLSAAQKLGIEGRVDHADVSYGWKDKHGRDISKKRRFSYLASAIKFAQKQRAVGQAVTVTAFCDDGTMQQICC